MRDFERARGRLRNLSFHARLVYTIFLLFTLLAIAFTAWLADDMVGLDLAEIGSYYAGEPSPDEALPPPPAGDGPSLELPVELDAGAPPAAAMSRRKLLEVAHFHLFSMPVYLLILSHLFMLSRAGAASKTAWITAGTLGVAAHVAAPWIAAEAGSSGAWLYGGSGALLAAAFVWMSVVPLWEMWAGSGRVTAEKAPPSRPAR